MLWWCWPILINRVQHVQRWTYTPSVCCRERSFTETSSKNNGNICAINSAVAVSLAIKPSLFVLKVKLPAKKSYGWKRKSPAKWERPGNWRCSRSSYKRHNIKEVYVVDYWQVDNQHYARDHLPQVLFQIKSSVDLHRSRAIKTVLRVIDRVLCFPSKVYI